MKIIKLCVNLQSFHFICSDFVLQVMPLENNMKNPNHFIGCPGVLNIGMAILVTLYAATGFFGYLKYGDSTEASITLNLPVDKM